jgi:bacterioferritin
MAESRKSKSQRNEKETIRQYRRRIKQADELNQFAITESLRNILV